MCQLENGDMILTKDKVDLLRELAGDIETYDDMLADMSQIILRKIEKICEIEGEDISGFS